MKLQSIEELNGFLRAVEKCEGNVYLISAQGDRLDLKSLLSRYVSIGRLLSDGGNELELFCDKRSDEQNFFAFFRAFPNAG